ncbi:hypothetical protein FW320_01570 [Azospirillum sp. Vi22]|uniref:AfsA-related hotdog domain-containing protein n=1 Tax=Azospirillum baldaniorum TaxID=1064539 RepID=UPI00157A4C7A|nr:AfsA-related hotdog domain-containing protein [Azospirillum baldaniorum]NUB04884.1 hypothetical protein [Azospirillum baldaniorum]
MIETVSIVVGDRFAEFARNSEVSGVSEFIGALRNGAAVVHPIVIGQGLAPEALDELNALLPPGPGQPAADLDIPTRATSALTHKRAAKNIMVSVPVARSGQLFEAELFLDDRNEVMEDHQTGQHIQGLALIEAARQLWTAVTERYLSPPDKPSRFVIDSVQTTFSRFVFPLPATMTLEVLDSASGPVQSTYAVRILILQNGQTSTTIDARYRVIDARVSERQEAQAARHAIRVAVPATVRPVAAASVAAAVA